MFSHFPSTSFSRSFCRSLEIFQEGLIGLSEPQDLFLITAFCWSQHKFVRKVWQWYYFGFKLVQKGASDMKFTTNLFSCVGALCESSILTWSQRKLFPENSQKNLHKSLEHFLFQIFYLQRL